MAVKSPKKIKKTVAKKISHPTAKKPTKIGSKPLSKATPKSVALNVLDLQGKVIGRVSVPAELFAARVNAKLVAQAVRVYLANQREGGASTKTRSEVEGSTRKIYRQKGTGRARHGAIRAPIFVGGGITFGPRPRDFRLNLPQKMRKAALASALTSKREEGNVLVVGGWSSLPPKTKKMVQVLTNIGASDRPLLVISKAAANVARAARNIPGVEIMPAQNLHTYAVLEHPKLVFTKEAVPLLTETFIR